MKAVLAALVVLCVAGAAYAGPLSFEAAVGGAANHQDVTYIDFDGLLPNGVSLSFAGDGGIKTGTTDDWAAPYFLNNGAIFGEAPVNGPDDRRMSPQGAETPRSRLPVHSGISGCFGVRWTTTTRSPSTLARP